MIINLTGDNISLTPTLKRFSKEHIQKLTHFNDALTRAEVLIKKDGISCIAEMNVMMPKRVLHATAKSDDMYKAIDGATKKITSQLRKIKTKNLNHKKGEVIAEVLEH